MKLLKRILALLAVLAFVLGLAGAANAQSQTIELNAADYPVTVDGEYTSMEEVAVYLATYGELPSNFITKKQAEKLGWNNRQGNLSEVAAGKSIGGDHFGNYEGSVPDGHNWTECDIDSDGGYRNGLRIVFSTDGLIYYSNDHYQTFRQVLVTEGAPNATGAASETTAIDLSDVRVKENGEYTSMEEVAVYLHEFGKLPSNYLTKTKAKKLGWKSGSDNLGAVAPDCAIGGSDYHDDAGRLPDTKGRTWKECDVNVVDGRRGVERLVWSNDGLIFYTADEYATFTQLY